MKVPADFSGSGAKFDDAGDGDGDEENAHGEENLSYGESLYGLTRFVTATQNHGIYLMASSDKKQLDIEANLFIGNFDENVANDYYMTLSARFISRITTAKVYQPSLRMSFVLIVVIDYSRPRH